MTLISRMPELKTANGTFIKSHNLQLVLDMIKDSGPISRAKISKLTGMSRSTSSLLVDELLKKNLVVETGKDASSGGRKPVLLKMNVNAGVAVGIKLMAEKIIAAIVNLHGEAVKILENPVSFYHDREEYLEKLTAVVDRLFKYHLTAHPKVRILGIGIGISGLVDSEHGTSLNSTILQWQNINLGEILEAKFQVPVHLENDVNAFTLGESWLGLAKREDNFLCVSIGRGIGLGIVLHGKLYRGSHHGAGEFGHIKVSCNPEDPAGSGGIKGSLEAFAADPAICSYVQDRLKQGNGSTLSSSKALCIEDVLNAAQAGDTLAIEAYERAGRYLGYGIATLINLFDPSLILISGEGTRAGEFLFPAMEQAIQENTVYDLDKRSRRVPILFEDDLWVRGVATLVIRKVFKIEM